MAETADAEAHRRLEALFVEGIGLPPAQRDAWLVALEIDERTRRTLAGMLEADAAADSITGRVGAVLSTAWYSITPGERLGRYRVLRELGRGGAGVVYLAERADEQFDQQVAIKLIGGVAGSEAAQQLRHERQLLATLDHPYIARLLDGGETAAGQPYLVMEYVRGAPIAVACRQHPLPVAARVELVMQIAHAVHYAHQRLVVHRDIKPGNVMLRDDGRPVLLDFGIAKLLGSDSRGTTQPWFTPAYASPEQRRGEPVSTASDIYALGVLLFELLTDQPPKVDQRLPRASDVAPPERRSELRGDLDAIIRHACAQDPRDRYGSARSLADDLERYLRGHPVRVARHSHAYLLRKLVRRRPLETTVLCVFVVALSLVGWRLADQRNRALIAEAAAIAQARDTEAVTTFVIDLFREAEPLVAGRGTMTAEALIDAGRDRLQHRTDLAAPQRARLAGTLGGLYRSLGQPTKASDMLETAITAAEQADAPVEERAGYLRLLASVLDQRGRHAEAERRYGQALALLADTANAGQRAADRARLGLMQARQRRFEEAEATLREAIDAARERFGDRHPRTAEAELYLAEMLALADRAAEARPLIDAPIAHLRAALAPDDPNLLAALTLQAGVLREAGEGDAAEQVLLSVMAQRRTLLAAGSWLISSVHDELGRLYYEQGRTAEATEQFRASLELSRHTLAADDPAFAIGLNNLASLYEEQGAYARAEPLMREALAIVQRNPEGHALQLARFRQNLGRLLLLAGQRDEARRWLELPVAGGADLHDSDPHDSDPRAADASAAEASDAAPAASARDGAGTATASVTADDPRLRLQRARQHLHLAEWHRRFGDPAEARRRLDALAASPSDLGAHDNPRQAFALRTRAALALAEGDVAAARALLDDALERIASRGPNYVGRGLIELERAQLEADAGRPLVARTHLLAAVRVLDAVLAAEAPQRADWVALAARIGTVLPPSATAPAARMPGGPAPKRD